MEIKTENIFITSHSFRNFDYYNNLAKRIKSKYEHVTIHYISTDNKIEKVESQTHIKIHIIKLDDYLSSDFIDLVESSKRYNVPGDLIKSDLRYVVGSHSEKILMAEKLSIMESITKLFKEFPPNAVFTSSGTNLLHSIAFHLGFEICKHVYRVHSYLNLNKNFQGYRVWFCSNNRQSLSLDCNEKFDYDDKLVNGYIVDLLEATEKRIFAIDDLSKGLRKRRMPLSFKDYASDLIQYLSIMTFEVLTKKQTKRSNIHKNRLINFWNSCFSNKLGKLAYEIPKNSILFAFNTPYDSQILVRAAPFRDLLSAAQIVSSTLPNGYTLCLREHPAFKGMFKKNQLKDFLNMNKNSMLINCEESIHDVIKRVDAVVVINNTTFVDAAIMRKPVIALGRGYFSGRNLCYEAKDVHELPKLFQRLRQNELTACPLENLTEAMSELLKETYPKPGVIYSNKFELICDGIFEKYEKIRLKW